MPVLLSAISGLARGRGALEGARRVETRRSEHYPTLPLPCQINGSRTGCAAEGRGKPTITTTAAVTLPLPTPSILSLPCLLLRYFTRPIHPMQSRPWIPPNVRRAREVAAVGAGKAPASPSLFVTEGARGGADEGPTRHGRHGLALVG
ncbi:hypothetical protein EV126DRAFT_396175 [Verticillium dahliae]|nr:hypothetical protein EV126DRAFT_396175 [Verticillium dahliae]